MIFVSVSPIVCHFNEPGPAERELQCLQQWGEAEVLLHRVQRLNDICVAKQHQTQPESVQETTRKTKHHMKMPPTARARELHDNTFQYTSRRSRDERCRKAGAAARVGGIVLVGGLTCSLRREI